MEFHGTLWGQMKYHLVPWNSIELSDCHFIQYHVNLDLHGIFNGTLEPPNKKRTSSMGFHGIRRAPFQMTHVFHLIPWNIPWNSMELWYRQMKYNLVPWNSMEYSMEFHGTLTPSNEISLSSMEFHGILRLSFYSIPCYSGLLWEIYGIQCNSGVAK